MPVPPAKRPTLDDIQALQMRPPHVWFAEVTEPLVDEFARDLDTLHRAVSAVREVFHFHERLWWYWDSTDKKRVHDTPNAAEFLKELKKRSNAFRALDAAANATKHHVRDHQKYHRGCVQIVGYPDPDFPHVVATATQVHRTIGDGGPNTLATIQEAMTVYRTYL
ncbi:hypothetical protein J2848_002398 [Azospirillum lipoferum]|uniref:Uncharacterized protein n=1 Tax=Azospirillum lipoferum TaxID=193 RepID=A0A5A9GSF7_AZOLI|nr:MULTISPECIES: hypothetical protein [Azospirillum]KAA0596712.1 hypothetical protein FZ942_11495 [Azospirillum lipoferum]MCP1610731.1 hypothetical protein [Azospirillum lipoferum]MDW5537823.1 hypothetical protein [Azospirillum sp. NL1]